MSDIEMQNWAELAQKYKAEAEQKARECDRLGKSLVQEIRHRADDKESLVSALRECNQLTARVKGWEDYWGCESPHDSHVSIGTSEKYARQLGAEQARANRLSAQVQVAEALAGELAEALRNMAPLAMDGVPKRGHLGACGPESGCDGICVDVASCAETLRAAHYALAKFDAWKEGR